MRYALAFLLVFVATPSFAGDLGFKEAAAKYAPGVPLFAEVLEAISWVESRHNPEAIRKNVRILEDGSVSVSHDFGHMQINDHFWKAEIDRIDPRLWERATVDPKMNTKIGAWILARNLKHYDYNIWNAIAAYNTGRAIDLEDCLKAYPAYQRGQGVTREQLQEAKDRVERGRTYALKVFRYLASQGHLLNSIPSVLLPAPAAVQYAENSQALPMRLRINIEQYRSSGSWRRVE